MKTLKEKICSKEIEPIIGSVVEELNIKPSQFENFIVGVTNITGGKKSMAGDSSLVVGLLNIERAKNIFETLESWVRTVKNVKLEEVLNVTKCEYILQKGKTKEKPFEEYSQNLIFLSCKEARECLLYLTRTRLRSMYSLRTN